MPINGLESVISLPKPIIMIQFKTTLLAATILFSFSLCAQGVDDRAKNKAENKANNRVDSKVDQGLDKGFDAIEGLFKKKKPKSAEIGASGASEVKDSKDTKDEVEEYNTDQSDSGAGMFGSMFEAAEWEDSYQFDFVSKSLVTSTDKKNKVEENEMEWMLGEDAFGMVIKDPKGKNSDVQVIFDYSNHSFITLTEEEGEKTGMAIAMNKDQIDAAIEEGVEEGTVDNGSFAKTGRTKTILGYLCHEYTFSDEDTEGVMWMTTELDIEMNKVFGMMTQGSKKKPTLPENYPQGYAMEMESRDLKKNDTHHYLVTEVNTNADLKLDLGPYNVMDPMGMMNNPGNK